LLHFGADRDGSTYLKRASPPSPENPETMTDYCCQAMAHRVNWHCDQVQNGAGITTGRRTRSGR
jgi:hypothetical protein